MPLVCEEGGWREQEGVVWGRGSPSTRSFCSASATVNEALTDTDREHAEFLQPDKNNRDR